MGKQVRQKIKRERVTVAQKRAFRRAFAEHEELIEILMESRLDSARRVVAELFEYDQLAKMFRLKGVGGATGVADQKVIDAAVDTAVMAAQDPGAEEKSA